MLLASNFPGSVLFVSGFRLLSSSLHSVPFDDVNWKLVRSSGQIWRSNYFAEECTCHHNMLVPLNIVMHALINLHRCNLIISHQNSIYFFLSSLFSPENDKLQFFFLNRAMVKLFLTLFLSQHTRHLKLSFNEIGIWKSTDLVGCQPGIPCFVKQKCI